MIQVESTAQVSQGALPFPQASEVTSGSKVPSEVMDSFPRHRKSLSHKIYRKTRIPISQTTEFIIIRHGVSRSRLSGATKQMQENFGISENLPDVKEATNQMDENSKLHEKSNCPRVKIRKRRLEDSQPKTVSANTR